MLQTLHTRSALQTDSISMQNNMTSAQFTVTRNDLLNTVSPETDKTLKQVI
ncbi:hypothetical protein GVN16_10550 [Emticicia sp. CRIBPO]|uniref:hypothetical protein n=1 Tax=Emticicia sp. CRIBPO TaxID=2683258 RepID=UPI001412CA0B|nr:hypothetical protein [Emticicia sp. CRIBPO]NBA86203.1 hypothetical protein [Emticicia sp. CRIBPO]